MKDYIITGAGSGIGRATAIMLSEMPDNRIMLVGRNSEKLTETKKLCANSSIHRIASIDVRSSAEWKSAYADFASADFNLCGVFANAGVGGANFYGDDKWEEIISINLTGTYVTIMEAYPHLKNASQKFKHIVITSSCLARFGVPDQSAYCTAKTGLLGLTRSLAVQWAREQILVNAICPGWVETEMAKASIERYSNNVGLNYDEGFKQQMDFVPTGKISQPGEIAAFVKFLFSDQQTSITGQGLDINNGSFMQ